MKRFYKIFIKMERDLELFDIIENGVYPWRLVRFKVFFSILESAGEIKKRSDSFNRSNLVKRLFSLLYEGIFFSSFNRSRDVDVLIFENSRKIRVDADNYIDPFTFDYIEKLKKSSISFEVVDIGHKGQHFEKASSFRSFATSIRYDFFYKMKLKFLRRGLSSDLKNKIRSLESYIYVNFGFSLNLNNLFLEKMIEFDFQYVKYKSLLKRRKCSSIYIVCSYGKEGLISAAKDMGVRVIEFQHGVMGKFHLGYSFPESIVVPYFPDEIKLFGKYWEDSTDLPTNQVALESYGYPYLTKKINKYLSVTKKQQVLIISQPGNVKDLVSFLLSMIKEHPNYYYVYRLHPKERINWQSVIPDLYDISLKENIIVDEGETDLYYSIAESRYIIGVNSAAIYESIFLGAKVILVKSAGVEYMENVVEAGHALLVSEASEVDFEKLEGMHSDLDKSYYYQV